MKIGILTFHNVPNYGAVLQAFALKTYLSELGNDVSIIDYQCPGNDSAFSPMLRKKGYINSSNLVKKTVKWLNYIFFAESAYSKKWAKFETFSHKFFNKISADGLFKEFDLVFCGSDQIWNPQITGGFRDVYFGLGNDGRCKVASYAASCGDIKEFDVEKKERLLAMVRNISFVGVREKSLFEFLKKENVDASINIDPTFLLNAEEYASKLNLKKTAGEKYLLQYSLQNDKKVDEIAGKIAKEKGLKVIKVAGCLTASVGERAKLDVGPEEFLEYLYNAEYVVTNSFHGVALSVGFKKDFSSLLPKQRKGRVADFLSALSLDDRICTGEKTVNHSCVNYDDVTYKLEDMISEAKRYIACVLESCR